jgi:hypothetical protein
VQAGLPSVVTSGTGSGKTEAFLLPVFAMLAKEAVHWPRPNAGYLAGRWWQDAAGRPFGRYTDLANRPRVGNPTGSPFVPQRDGERRVAGIRALVLYPMNALVEDQLARLRRALDSGPARGCMDRFFNGNRIFLGKYTSATPVTGCHYDPRPGPDEHKRRDKKLKTLFASVRQIQLTQEAARDQGDADARFLFPSTDGDEMVTRWDMQSHPPDILITNISMLNAMLAREVDAPIFDETRKRLQSDNDSYFYLILDELHLQRGSSGTEVSFLLRLLLERLGLDQPQHRHKLRVLASSASLPMDGERGERSLQYLWDFFGSNGTWTRPGQQGERSKEDWRRAVLSGAPVPPRQVQTRLVIAPLIDFLARHSQADQGLAGPVPPLDAEREWRAACTELVPSPTNAPLHETVRACIENAASRLEWACRNGSSGVFTPTSLQSLATSLFGDATQESLLGARSLLVIRGLGDYYRQWFPGQTPPEATSFRVHLFFRSIEGLFGPALLPANLTVPPSELRLVGELTVERGLRFVTINGESRRLLELVYCECCGELFFAGMKGGRGSNDTLLELLPIDPDLDGLPDSASSQLFEELSAEQFAVFWPRHDAQPEVASSDQRHAEWRKASLDPVTGIVSSARRSTNPWGTPGRLDGYLYVRQSPRQDRHGRARTDKGTCVPYACPACGTSYEYRKLGFRLSPIRNFRTGFAKTTQLLATEIFEILQKSTADPKLVSFSDSRQDAAKAALDIERRHHEDLRRQLFFETIGEVARRRRPIAELQAELQAVSAQIQEALSAQDHPRFMALTEEYKQLQAAIASAADSSIPMGEIVETLDVPGFQGVRPGRDLLKPFLRHFAQLGVHPTDPTGVKHFRMGREFREWFELFETFNGSDDWKDEPGRRNEIDDLRRDIVGEAQEAIASIIFSKTYFSLEETGLAYPCLPLRLATSQADQDVLASFVRVLADSYRLHESPYDDAPKDWTSVADIRSTERVFRFAAAVYGPSAPTELQRVLAVFQQAGHANGIIHSSCLSIKLTQRGDSYWRCANCGRVHLHLGANRCTRCFELLSLTPSGTVEEIRRSNFLGKRVERGETPFRVRCEELTGQTDDPAERQRRFKGILFGRGNGPVSEVERKARLIDLLAVTTTMEVGIDIGPLQAVFQANMPPQRFNYQQRVGRAGRRGQSFSIAMTVCRSKSHDLYYFRNPERITGDPPPPPFLTKRQALIARRLLRKAWLSKAFERIRSECQRLGISYPGDDAKPDIHGEFVPSADYFDQTQNWKDTLLRELRATLPDRDRYAAVLSADSDLTPEVINAALSPEEIIQEIDEMRSFLGSDIREGLAHSLAEAGLLPMFGMPTRVRNLYMGYGDDASDEGQLQWTTIDRDLDVAIYEFSPGAVIVKDKQQHSCIGFTGPIEDPFRPGTSTRPRDLDPYSGAFGEAFWLIQCTHCGSWHRYAQKPASAECSSCMYMLPVDVAGECRTPMGFRTDFNPRIINDNDSFGGRHRSINAEYLPLDTHDAPKSNVSLDYKPQARTYRLNRGSSISTPAGTSSWTGFSVDSFAHQMMRNTRLLNQLISLDHLPQNGFQPDQTPSPIQNLWLAAPKTTDALFLAAARVRPGLQTQKVSGAAQVTAVRAAALSASFILVQRAALDLDIDPEEFDIVDPRIHVLGGNPVPVLQITDHLVNGSGFCERLATVDANGRPIVVNLIQSIISDVSEFPLRDFRGTKGGVDHAPRCDQACYLCLQRYGNQSYHGLLDWRLGLSFLETLQSADFACGLDGCFDSPSLSDWPNLALRYATELVTRYRTNGETRSLGPLTAFRFNRSEDHWAIVVHPLWDIENPTGILQNAIDQLGVFPEFTNTFELSRRQVSERERLVREWNR